MSFTTWPAEPVAGAPTPWGPAQYATTWIPGQAVLVGTASHGGFWISRHLWDSLDPELTAYAQEWAHGWRGYFEEDCAAWKLIQAVPELRAFHSKGA